MKHGVVLIIKTVVKISIGHWVFYLKKPFDDFDFAKSLLFAIYQRYGPKTCWKTRYQATIPLP